MDYYASILAYNYDTTTKFVAYFASVDPSDMHITTIKKEEVTINKRDAIAECQDLSVCFLQKCQKHVRYFKYTRLYLCSSIAGGVLRNTKSFYTELCKLVSKKWIFLETPQKFRDFTLMGNFVEFVNFISPDKSKAVYDKIDFSQYENWSTVLLMSRSQYGN